MSAAWQRLVHIQSLQDNDPMAFPVESSEGLTIKDVARILMIRTRQIMYLRETEVVVPEVIGNGRGKPCKYSHRDLEMVYVALIALEALGTEAKKEAVDALRAEPNRVVSIRLSDCASLTVDLSQVRQTVSEWRAARG